jgi:menaquinone-dependent protoporphyrinogen IX oxidase
MARAPERAVHAVRMRRSTRSPATERETSIATGAASPKVLLVYYSYTGQSLRVAEAMAEALGERGCDVRQAAIEFTDKRYADRFSRFPSRHGLLDVLAMLPAQLRGVTGEIRIPDAARGQFDLICIGSPTWWFRPSVPIRSFLKSDAAGRLLDGKPFAAFVVCRRYWSTNLRAVEKLGVTQGGEYVNGIHFSFAGGQVRSLLSLFSYLATGENRERCLGVRIPPANLKPDYHVEARAFAHGLADGLVGAGRRG